MTRLPRSFASLTFFASSILLFGWYATVPNALHAQAAESDSNGNLVFKVNAHTVVVDVVVTDRNGKPVKGLRKEDFRLEEDGHPQKLSTFEDHTEVVPTVVLGPGDLPRLPPDVFTNIPRVRLSDVVTVVLLDSLNTELKDQAYVRKQMLRFLQNRPTGGRIAIFALGSKLRYIQGFTQDPAILTAALRDISRGAGPIDSDLLVSKTQAAVTQTVADELLNVGNGGNPTDQEQQMAAVLRQFLGEETASQADLRVALTLEAFQDLAHYLSGIPGRKNVVWFSSAFPLTLFPDQTLTNPLVAQREYTEKVRKTDALLAAAQVAVYPVAAEGLTADSLYDVNVKMAVIGEAQKKNQVNSLQGDAAERIGTHTTMQQVAEDTGGQAIFNTNGLADALAHVQSVGSSFYTLSYVPTNATSNGQFRQIHLKLAGGYTLDYRRGYFAADTKAELAEASKRPSDPLSAFMGPGKPAVSDISMALRVIPASVGESTTAIPAAVATTTPPAQIPAQTPTQSAADAAMDAAEDFDTQPAAKPMSQPTNRPAEQPVAQTVSLPVNAQKDQPANPPATVAQSSPAAKSATPASQINRAGDNPRLSGNLKRYTVDFLLTTHGVQMETSLDGTHHGRIEAALIAYTQGGRALNWAEREIHFDLDAAHFAQAEKSGLNFRMEIDVPKEGYSIRSGVYDLASERAGSLEIPLSTVVTPVESAQARAN